MVNYPHTMERKLRILMAEDNDRRYELVCEFIDTSRFSVDRTRSGKSAYQELVGNEYDLAVLDLHLSDGISGQDVIKAVRPLKPTLPIVAVSNESGDPAVAECLALDADDVLIAPFSKSTFVARIERAMRHCATMRHDEPLEFGAIRLDPVKRSATYCGKKLDLNGKEFTILKKLLENRGRTAPSDELEKAAWGDVIHQSTRLAHVIAALRVKLQSLGAPRNIITNFKGVGYSI